MRKPAPDGDGLGGKERRRRWATAGLAILWLALMVLFIHRLQGRSFDDFFITYRYAHNLARGEGLVFNPGERVFGLTDPGMGIVLTALHLATRVPYPWLGALTTALAALALAGLLLAAVDPGRRRDALLGGTLLLGFSYLWQSNGSAALPALALLLLAAAWASQRPVAAGVAAGFAVWLRPDAALGVGLLGLLLWREDRRFPIRLAAAAGAVVLLGLAALWAYYGTPVPATFVAKRAMGITDPLSPSGWRFWAGAWPPLREHLGPLAALWLGVGAAGQGLVARRFGRPGRVLVLFAAGLAVLYPLLRVPFFHWYILPCLVALTYGVACAAGGCTRWLAGVWTRGRGWRRAAAAVAAGGVAGVLVSQAVAGGLWYRDVTGYAHTDSYRLAGEWLRDNTPPDAAISYHEIGALGFLSDRPIRDLLGLVTPEVLPHVLQADLAGAFLMRPTELVLFHSERGIGQIVRRPWFKEAYEEVHRLPVDGVRGPATVVFFQRRPGAELPPPPPLPEP